MIDRDAHSVAPESSKLEAGRTALDLDLVGIIASFSFSKHDRPPVPQYVAATWQGSRNTLQMWSSLFLQTANTGVWMNPQLTYLPHCMRPEGIRKALVSEYRSSSSITDRSIDITAAVCVAVTD